VEWWLSSLLALRSTNESIANFTAAAIFRAARFECWASVVMDLYDFAADEVGAVQQGERGALISA
jgi:hypothetical protein